MNVLITETYDLLIYNNFVYQGAKKLSQNFVFSCAKYLKINLKHAKDIQERPNHQNSM